MCSLFASTTINLLKISFISIHKLATILQRYRHFTHFLFLSHWIFNEILYLKYSLNKVIQCMLTLKFSYTNFDSVYIIIYGACDKSFHIPKWLEIISLFVFYFYFHFYFSILWSLNVSSYTPNYAFSEYCVSAINGNPSKYKSEPTTQRKKNRIRFLHIYFAVQMFC